MVNSVQVVSMLPKAKEERERTAYSGTDNTDKKSSFSNMLQQAIQDTVPSDSLDCQTVTYGRDSRIQTFLYRSREYTY